MSDILFVRYMETNFFGNPLFFHYDEILIQYYLLNETMMQENNPLFFRFEVYSTGTSSLQTNPYTKMGSYLIRLFVNFLCSSSYSANLVDLFCIRPLSLFCAGDFSIHAC